MHPFRLGKPTIRPGILVTLMVAAAVGSIGEPASATGGCGIAATTMVVQGQSVQGALAAAPIGAVVCLAAGTYTIASPLVPKSGQTIMGDPSASAPLIRCQAAYCVDGFNRSSNVTVSHLVLAGASIADLRTGNYWMVSNVEVEESFMNGIQLTGTGSVVSNSYAHNNGRFGIDVVGARSAQVLNNEIAYNPTNASYGAGYSGGLKLNGATGVMVSGNYVHNNGGGAALWLDNDTHDFQIVGNRVLYNADDAIRVEISCYGTVQGNVAGGSRAGAEIDLFNAHNVRVAANTVNVPAGVAYGIRMLGNGRRNSPGSRYCRIRGSYRNVYNQAIGNAITMPRSAFAANGVFHSAGRTAHNSWMGNVYLRADCSGRAWKWWTGRLRPKLTFSQWRRSGQDLNGTCSGT